MKTPAELLELPVERSARWLALSFLEEAAAAHARLDADDDEALHDFRVALRRLRSTARAYRRYLAGSLAGKDRRRLGALADATGAPRDAEVHVAWLEKRLPRIAPGARPAAAALLADLRREHADAADAMQREVAREFPRERWRLSRRLRFFRAEMELDEPAGGPRLSAVLGRLARELAAELERQLAAVRSVEHQEQAHRARISAKRLRYLLEPFAAELEGGAAAVKQLKQLQDVLGDMHDAHVLLGRVAPAAAGEAAAEAAGEGAPTGWPALGALLERERGERFAELEAGWLGGRAAEFFAAVRALGYRAAAAGEPDREIERKYLLKRMPRLTGLEVEVREIDQGWLPGERLAERLRRSRTGDRVRYYRTVKLGTGISRLELEEETTERVFRRLWSLTRGRRVSKVRHRVRDGELTWEIDRFRGRPLVLAEVELPGE
ncbi:MAG TPA: CHAD domain-containing protein, partial [Longimicrobiaceae bacterium]|nr:CHAD domain-containing protein [Longimicrobiaceae bacterium]